MLLLIVRQLIRRVLLFCYDRNGLGDGTSGGGKVEVVVGALNVAVG